MHGICIFHHDHLACEFRNLSLKDSSEETQAELEELEERADDPVLLAKLVRFYPKPPTKLELENDAREVSIFKK